MVLDVIILFVRRISKIRYARVLLMAGMVSLENCPCSFAETGLVSKFSHRPCRPAGSFVLSPQNLHWLFFPNPSLSSFTIKPLSSPVKSPQWTRVKPGPWLSARLARIMNSGLPGVGRGGCLLLVLEGFGQVCFEIRELCSLLK